MHVSAGPVTPRVTRQAQETADVRTLRPEGRPSHPEFNVRKYLQLNQDVAREIGQNNYIEAINHYVLEGYKKGRRGI